ncbi:MAG: hypothetical protein JNL65_10425 [Saprospiraceae bacterium]|nr:hypothetical protein [Saprospiraceae bacterium]
MPTEAGLGNAKTYSIQQTNGNNSAAFEPKKHYLRVDAVSWYLNKESDFWKTFIASGALQIKLPNENYEVGLGTYKLDDGMKTAPVFNRPIIDDRVYLGGSLTVSVTTQAIKKDTLLSKILKDLGNSTVDVVTGAIQGATFAGPTASLLEVSKSLTSNIKEILNQGEKKIDFFSIENTFQLSNFTGSENYILLHRGVELNNEKLKIDTSGNHSESLTYDGKFLDDGAWVLLRISRIDKYSGVRPWYMRAREIRSEIDNFMDRFEFGSMSKEQALNQLTPSDADPNNTASKVMELISIIRNDAVLSYRDALIESSMYKNLLQAARVAVNANDVNEYKKIRDSFINETTKGVEPNKLVASILKEEYDNLLFRDKLTGLKSNALEGNDLWRSIRHTSPLSIR